MLLLCFSNVTIMSYKKKKNKKKKKDSLQLTLHIPPPHHPDRQDCALHPHRPHPTPSKPSRLRGVLRTAYCPLLTVDYRPGLTGKTQTADHRLFRSIVFLNIKTSGENCVSPQEAELMYSLHFIVSLRKDSNRS